MLNPTDPTASSSPDEIPGYVAQSIRAVKLWPTNNELNLSIRWLADAYERVAKRESELYDKLECAEHELDEARAELQEARADIATIIRYQRGHADITKSHIMDVVSRYDKREAAIYLPPDPEQS